MYKYKKFFSNYICSRSRRHQTESVNYVGGRITGQLKLNFFFCVNLHEIIPCFGHRMLIKKILFFNMIEEPNLSQRTPVQIFSPVLKRQHHASINKKDILKNEIEDCQIRHVQSVLSPHSSLLHLGSFRLFRPL